MSLHKRKGDEDANESEVILRCILSDYPRDESGGFSDTEFIDAKNHSVVAPYPCVSIRSCDGVSFGIVSCAQKSPVACFVLFFC